MTLTETAYVTRRVIRLGVALVIFLIILRVLWVGAFRIYRRFVPEPPPTPQVAFGKLPKLSFPQKTDLPEFDFVLETPEGDLPKLSPVGTVYFMPKPASSFLALDEARKKTTRLGFTAGEEKVSDVIYRFKHPKAPGVLEMNIVSGAFSINYDLNKDTELSILRPQSTETAVAAVRAFLSSAGLLADDLKNGKATYDFIKAQLPNLVPVTSLSEANFIRVNIFRQDYNKLPVLPPNPTRGNVWFLVSGARERERQITLGEYHYFQVDPLNLSTYPLKTTTQAWDELKNKGGFIANLGDNKDGKVTVRRVYLAYYDANEPQDFLQPITVFEGDRGFVAYVPAVASEYYGE